MNARDRGQRVHAALARAIAPRIFNWARDCPEDVAKRAWPAVAGRGRGRRLDGER